jgi:hypothetical protein
MASLVLGAVGSAIGGPLGGALGTLLGAFIDREIAGLLTPAQQVEGQRMTDLQIQTSTEGAPIPRVFGYSRLSGQVIWATHFLETKSATTTGGGKGGGGGAAAVTTTNYNYSISFAVGICEGVVQRIGRIWANGSLLDQSKATIRFYQGTETQTADPLIQSIEGVTNAPAFRGLSYIVLENLNLGDFGNQIPSLQLEIVRAMGATVPGALEYEMKAVTLIPGAGEFTYATTLITGDKGGGKSVSENSHTPTVNSDSISSLDDLAAVAPNVGTIAVTVGWFGNDLRAGSCQIMPLIKSATNIGSATKVTYPQDWGVDGIARAAAQSSSLYNGNPASGGTPSDQSIVEVIANLKSRGKKITLSPFLFMDIPVGNTLPTPYSDNAATVGQPSYPWRGRISCSPAAGYVGTVDKTATASSQIDAFFGTATAANFLVSGTTVTWTGGADWGYRRMILHYAKLAVAAGGVDAILIGSELVGLTQVRSSASVYPTVAKLKALAADVKAIVGAGCKVGYAADWSEYHSHRPRDGTNDVYFNLDPLWTDPNIDFIGVDNYLKLSDWRDGTTHLDYNATTGPWRLYDPTYLKGNIAAGEDYDWYYATPADRDSQVRTPITDGANSKPWVFRQKDFANWWQEYHMNRPGGTEFGSVILKVPPATNLLSGFQFQPIHPGDLL